MPSPDVRAPRFRRTAAPSLRGLLLGATLLVPGALAAQQATPQTHSVRPGDTLWSLAQQYLGDPLLWPEIYRLNTDVVEDPHWIYPTEVLRLAPGQGVSAVPAQDTPGPVAAQAGDRPWEPMAEGDSLAPEGGLFPMARQYGSARETIRSYSEEAYRPVRRQEFYGAGFLTEGEQLPFGRIKARVAPLSISSITNSGHSKLYGEVEVSPPSGARYEIGDTLLVVTRPGGVDDFGEMVVPQGAVVVQRVDDGRPIAKTVYMFEGVFPGQWTLPLEKFPTLPKVRAKPVTDGAVARIIGWPHRSELKTPQQYVFLDKGKLDGVGLGDLFEVRRDSGGYYTDGTARTDQLLARLQVVHVRDHSATAVIFGMAFADLYRGLPVRQVAKLPI
ncbi:MAG: LysM peptidoglycan-binding domain-containing protein [Gemmatimonadales bacterium]|nr:LysM peptidoglycan-binding domain-containing protein [Gemmatimonadales bacterium]